MSGHEKYIYSADDFGISPGVNQAVVTAYQKGKLDRASIMANMSYFNQAIQLHRKKAPGLKIGLHINLSLGKPILDPDRVRMLVNKRGNFKRDFVGYVGMLWFINKEKLMEQVETEIEAQILRCKTSGLNLDHIDSHRYVHVIPWIHKIVSGLARKHNIQNIRVINESFVDTFLSKPTLRFVFNGNLIKFIILKTFSSLNRSRSSTYMVSVLHSCRLDEKLIANLRSPKKYNRIEIVFHPGMPELDRVATELPEEERGQLLSEYRRREFEIMLNNKPERGRT